MRIVVVMDGPETVDPETDTSLALIGAARERGHAVWHAGPADVELLGGRVHARAAPATPRPTARPALELGPSERLDLAEVDAVLVRVDPPFDSTYLHLTLLLDLVAADTLVCNSPRGLRDANEKLYACRFPDLTPATMVTAEPERILTFAADCDAAVVKPIDGHGGRGVMIVRPGDPNGASIVETVTEKGTRAVVVQQFLEQVTEGDKRVLLLDGEPLGAILRLPARTDFRANIGVGGRTVAADLDDADRTIIDGLAPSLQADGLHFVGIDVVGGLLTEVNVTSPTGLCQLGRSSSGRPDLEVVRWLERQAR